MTSDLGSSCPSSRLRARPQEVCSDHSAGPCWTGGPASGPHLRPAPRHQHQQLLPALTTIADGHSLARRPPLSLLCMLPSCPLFCTLHVAPEKPVSLQGQGEPLPRRLPGMSLLGGLWLPQSVSKPVGRAGHRRAHGQPKLLLDPGPSLGRPPSLPVCPRACFPNTQFQQGWPSSQRAPTPSVSSSQGGWLDDRGLRGRRPGPFSPTHRPP